MSTSIQAAPKAALRAIFSTALLAIGACVFAGAWLAVAVLCDSRAGWMALVAALIVTVLLRIVGMKPGTSRAMFAVFATAAWISLGEWLLAALPIALQMGQFPLETAQRIGPNFGWMLIRLGTTPLDWLMVFVALLLAAWFAR